MKENEAFVFIGDMPLFNDLLNNVLSLIPEDWSKYKDRKNTGGVASYNSDTIPLIYDTRHRLNSNILHENYERFGPYIDEVILATVKYVGEVKVQQAMLTKLNAHTVIPRHRDRGPLTAKTHRIHVPVITNTKCLFKIGDESKNLEAGQIWIIDNVDRYHSVENNGDRDRVHLIIDAI
jgi:hypothetical protein